MPEKPPVIEAPALVVAPPPSELDTADHKAAKTTAEEDLKTAGQRKVNLIWEVTQSLIAISVTAATVYASLNKIESQLLGNAFILVVSMYLVRTNHTKTGGVAGTDSR